MRGKILVIRGGAIGDFILTLPVFSALRAAFPETRIEVLGYPRIAGLAQLSGLVDAVRPIEAQALAGFFARGGSLATELRDYFAGFSIILSYLYDPDEIFQANVAACTKAQFIAGPHRPEEAAGLHATEVLLQPLTRLAISHTSQTPRLNLRPPPGPATPPRLALHPGSGSERKNWPLKHWETLVSRLVEQTGWQILLAGGEAEAERLDRLTKIIPANRLSLQRNVPLPELAVELAGCQAFIGHDSGLTHLAAALSLPTLVLWGPTVEAVWCPRGNNVQILRHPAGLSGLEPGVVWAALATLVSP